MLRSACNQLALLYPLLLLPSCPFRYKTYCLFCQMALLTVLDDRIMRRQTLSLHPSQRLGDSQPDMNHPHIPPHESKFREKADSRLEREKNLEIVGPGPRQRPTARGHGPREPLPMPAPPDATTTVLSIGCSHSSAFSTRAATERPRASLGGGRERPAAMRPWNRAGAQIAAQRTATDGVRSRIRAGRPPRRRRP